MAYKVDKKQLLPSNPNTLSVNSDFTFKTIFEFMVFGCICYRLEGDTPDEPSSYSVQYVNQAMHRIIEDEPDYTDKSTLTGFLSANQVDLFESIAKVAITGAPVGLEQYFVKQQKWYSISIYSPKYGYAVLVFVDITERMFLEKKQVESQTLCEALLKQSSDAIALVDSQSKNIVKVNARLCQMTGYTVEELCKMSLYYLFEGIVSRIEDCQNELQSKQYLPATNRNVLCKDGTVIQVERVVCLFPYNSRTMELITLYDVREERNLQQMIKEDAFLAGQLQQKMLPANFSNQNIEIKGIFKPLRMVSGDFFDYRLSNDGFSLTGFLVDVAGHGLATALQTAAINVLLQEVIITEEIFTEQELHTLNQKMSGYFDEGSFAALLLFRFDFRNQLLTVACCGINRILAFCSTKRGWIKASGSVMGTFSNPAFSLIHVPLQPGDCFYFLSDGISEILPDSIMNCLEDFSITTTILAETTNLKSIRDDCSAVCIKLKGRYGSLQYFFSGLDEVVTMYKQNRLVLSELAGSQALCLEIALNEAINNILSHGSGCGRVRIKRTKSGRVILRIMDCKQGFNAQAILEHFANKTTEDIAEMVSTLESYRGILIMKLYTDRLLYNKNGTEVMLVRNIIPEIHRRHATTSRS